MTPTWLGFPDKRLTAPERMEARKYSVLFSISAEAFTCVVITVANTYNRQMMYTCFSRMYPNGGNPDVFWHPSSVAWLGEEREDGGPRPVALTICRTSRAPLYDHG